MGPMAILIHILVFTTHQFTKIAEIWHEVVHGVKPINTPQLLRFERVIMRICDPSMYSCTRKLLTVKNDTDASGTSRIDYCIEYTWVDFTLGGTLVVQSFSSGPHAGGIIKCRMSDRP